MNHLVACAAAEEAFAITGEFEAVKTLLNGRVGNGMTREEVDDADLVCAVPAMQHSGKPAIRVYGHIDWEIPKFDLGACGPQRPLVRQEHRAIRLFAGQI